MTTISAKSILASRHAITGKRVDTLLCRTPLHASPCEHQCCMDEIIDFGDDRGPVWEHPELGGNLGPGFIQYRKTLAGECL